MGKPESQGKHNVSKSVESAEPIELTRVLDAGRFALDPVRHAPLLALATHFLWVKSELGGIVWPEDVLTQNFGTVRDCERWIREHEGFNTAFCQKARQQVIDEAATCRTRFFVELVKGCHRVEVKAAAKPDWYRARCRDEKPERCREYAYVPEGVSPTEADFAEIRALVAQTGKATANIQAALAGERAVSANALAILHEIRRLAEARSGRPNYGAVATEQWLRDKFVQIQLDYRVIGQPHCKTFRAALGEALATANKAGFCEVVLRMASPIPGRPGIPIPVRLCKSVAKRWQDADIRTVAVEIGKGLCRVRLVVGKTVASADKTPIPAGAVLVADDKGLCNTETFGVYRTPVALDETGYAALSAKTKEECRQRLATHTLPQGFETLAQEIWSGSRFIECLRACEAAIACIQKEIAVVSRRGLELRRCINRHLDQGDDTPIDEGQSYADPFLDRLRRRFLGGRVALSRLIVQRKALRTRMAGLKASWLGHLANRVIGLAEEHKAVAIVMERLTYTAGEKGAKDWRGKDLAVRINWSARGQLEDRIEEKAQWRGLRVLFAPSFYTSCTCLDHNRTHKSYRKGEVFSCPVCGAKHADANATRTTCGSLFLQPPVPSSENVRNADPSPTDVPTGSARAESAVVEAYCEAAIAA